MTPADAQGVDAVVARIRSVYSRWRRDTTVAQMRADWDALFSERGEAERQMVDASGVRCQWVRAPQADRTKVIVYFHGGGFQIGSLDSHGELMARLSRESGVSVLGVDYRLAPEHRFPAPVDDAETVIDWLHSQGFDATRIALAGDSAGGGLALSLLLRLQEHGKPQPAAAYLLSAWTDLTASGASYENRAAVDPLNQKPMLLLMARAYMGERKDPEHPQASPRFADASQLGALPPLLLQVGEREVVASDTEDFAARVVAAGGHAQVQVWPAMIHVFQQFPAELPAACEALALGARFLATHLGGDLSGKTSS